MKNLTIGVCVILMATTGCLAKPWRGLIPLKSDRMDVERLLGPSSSEDFVRYALPNETVDISYSRYTCDSSDRDKEEDLWDVSPGRVISISVSPRKRTPVTELPFSIRAFAKIPGDKDIVEHYFYVNARKGFSIEVLEGMVVRFVYEPTAKDQKLLCTNSH